MRQREKERKLLLTSPHLDSVWWLFILSSLIFWWLTLMRFGCFCLTSEKQKQKQENRIEGVDVCKSNYYFHIIDTFAFTWKGHWTNQNRNALVGPLFDDKIDKIKIGKNKINVDILFFSLIWRSLLFTIFTCSKLKLTALEINTFKRNKPKCSS